MRLIDADAAIDTLKELTANGTNKGMVFGEDAVHRIEILPSVQPEQRWIPCSERLPEERGLYLTTTKNKEVYCDYWNEDNFDRTEMVIAWMPLPESYQEGGE